MGQVYASIQAACHLRFYEPVISGCASVALTSNGRMEYGKRGLINNSL